jgi:hypothetical protein
VLNGHDHLYARYRPLKPVFNPATNAWTGVSDPNNGIREFTVGTGGETLDAVAYGTASDPSGDPNFNTNNLEAASGQYWGVMGLTLTPNGYAWDFESALKDPAQPAGGPSFSDKGVGFCHGGVNGPVSSGPLTVTPGPLPNGTVGTPYSQQLIATGGVPPYTWKVIGGATPAGFSLSLNGLLSGTTANSFANNFYVQVSDSTGASVTPSGFSLIIH